MLIILIQDETVDSPSISVRKLLKFCGYNVRDFLKGNIWDRPDSHPVKQVKLAEDLYELAIREDVAVATHNVDFVKYLRVKLLNDKKAKKVIKLHLFTAEGLLVDQKLSTLDRLANAKKQLLESYFDLFIEGL